MAVLINTIGAWLSLVERFVRDEEVVGSNPVAPIFYILFYSSDFKFISTSASIFLRAPLSEQRKFFIPLNVISQIYFSKFEYKTPVHCPYSI